MSGMIIASAGTATPQMSDIDKLDLAEQTSVEAAVDSRIANELGPAYPGIGNLLAEDPANQQGPKIQQEILNTLEHLLRAGAADPPERCALLLLAADRLAGHVRFEGNRQRLANDGLKFAHVELGGSWFYTHNVLWRVWKDYGNTNWGEWAFVLLLENGWDTSQLCASGTDQVHPVIHHGEDFLAARPHSPRRLEVLYLVAQAYESWWSISQLPDCRSGKEPGCDEEEAEEVNPAKFREGGITARKKAVAYYRRVLAIAPQSPEGQDAQERLPLLDSGKDTHQRRFYCVYD